LADFFSFVASSFFPNDVKTSSLDTLEPDMVWHHCLSTISPIPFYTQIIDLLKKPFSYAEAISRPDASTWCAAMDHEKKSLAQMGAFEEVNLLHGECVIGLTWVYAYKTNAEGVNIKKKARVVAQGFC
jgi:hypothetical protein